MYSSKPSKYLAHELPFRLESLVATDSPEGSEGDWYRYVIVQGANHITGVRCGGENEVKSIVREMVDRLNERREGKARPKSKTVQSAAKSNAAAASQTAT